jgi:cysteine-rich repeat protein
MGDVMAGDHVFSFNATLPVTIVPGTRSINFTVTDAENRGTGASVLIIVGAPPAMCGNSTIEGGEQCDDGNTNAGDCCSPTCTFESAATVCRAAGGACDVEEKCTGNSARCPGDVKSSGVCRAAAGVCDVAEKCDGMGVDCPADAFSTQTCRAAAGSCDVLEQCDGTSAMCPTNAFAPEEQTCGNSQVCRAGTCTSTSGAGGGGGNVGGGGCTCLAAPGSESGVALLGLMLLGLISRRRRD